MAQASIVLLVSIGNPEKRYLPSRHNAGHWLAERIADRYGLDWRVCPVAEGLLASGDVAGHKLRLFRSGISMNISGRVVASVVRYYRAPIEKMMVLHDEMDFPPGAVRMKFSGGAAGHNGLKSIMESLGSRDFWRCRIGIGHPGRPDMARSFVLHPPTAPEQKLIDMALEHFSEKLPGFVGADREKALTGIHSFTASDQSAIEERQS